MPNLLIILAAQFLVRIFVIGPSENWLQIILNLNFLLLCTATILIAAAGYIINDYYDIKIDIINNPKRVYIGKVFTRRVALFTHFAFNFMAIFISLFLGWKIFVIVFMSGFIMWYYSNSLKRLALWGNIAISLLTGISIYYLTFLSDNNLELVIIYASFAFVISLIREIIKDMEDIKGDALYGCKTLPIVWGIKRTKYFVYALSLLFIIILGFLFRERNTFVFVVYFIAVLFPLFVLLLVKLYKAENERDYNRLSSISKVIMLMGLLSILIP